MPYDLCIVRSKDFVRLDAQGHFDLATTRRLLSDVIWACINSRIGRVMLDVRDATAELTSAQLSALASVACEVAPPPETHKIAILTRPEVQFENASLVADNVQENGWNMQAFHEFEPAFEWIAH